MTTACRVDWDRFQDLPGATTTNFEALCRALVRLHYGRFGIFRATAQMPGIEFHLRLNADCALGKAGDWLGWQCRWYGINRGTSLGAPRRTKILKAIRTTEERMPNLTDWVLWTRHPLTAGDDRWFHEIKSKHRLHVRDASYAEDLLSGDGIVLRETYFGEWILRPETLERRHEYSVSSIRTRWLHEAHQEVEAERTLRRILGEAASWGEMYGVAERLEASARAIRAGHQPPPKFTEDMRSFLAELDSAAATLRAAPKLLAKGDFDLLQQTLELRPTPMAPELCALPRRLRSLRLLINFHATNGFVFHQQALHLLSEMQRCLGIRIHAVMGDAGGGKTQLAAELTAPQKDRPAGILLHGRDLKSGDNLDDLVKSFVIAGKPMPSFEAALAALDAASQRSRRRLPIVIDGLNEAEDPRDWKNPLSQTDTLMKRFPGVLLVVTLRTGAWRPNDDERYWNDGRPDGEEGERSAFARMALPEGTPLVEMNGFGAHTAEAVARYFRHFRINAQMSEAPSELLAHPLTLRIFCEVTNPPPQKREVGPDALPRSLVALFDRYLANSVERIGALSPKEAPYSPHDVRRALNRFALELWKANSRELDQDAYREQIGDAGRIWSHSLVKLMEQEGVILRVAKPSDGKYGVIPVYDALGGHLIASALLAEMGRAEFIAWIQKPEVEARFDSEKWQELHPMANDIFRSLVAMTPRRFHQEQLWSLVPPALRAAALFEATGLEGDLIDRATVDEIAKLVRDSTATDSIFARLRRTRGIPRHPLNSVFLDAQLRQMTNAERDLRWTEMLRKDNQRQYQGMPRVGEDWENDRSLRSETDRLRARWMMWLLTSTAHEIRLKVTRALYWFGRGDPQALFPLALESLSISDPYVPERILAACYGVVMDRSGTSYDPAYETTVLKDFARALYERMFALRAPHATTHILMREYARRIIEVAQQKNKGLLTTDDAKRVRPSFPKDLHREYPKVELEDDEGIPRSPALRMDFLNYTLGRIIPSRAFYNFEHPEFRKVVAQVLGRIRELGWTSEAFEKLDDLIGSDHYRRREERTGRKVDRYGKKYSWIAYYELAGMRADLGLIDVSHRDYSDRPSDIDIDPSFPEAPHEERLTSENWLSGTHKTLPAWIARGPCPNTTPLVRRSMVFGENGPWLMLDGYFTQQDKVSGRDLFCFVRAFVARNKDAVELVRALRKQSMRGRWLPEKPAESYAFMGEFPWGSSFCSHGPATLKFVTERRFVTVMRSRTEVLEGADLEKLDRALKLIRERKPIAKELSAYIINNVKTERVPVREVREKAIKFKVVVPICDFHWEGPTIDDRSAGGVVLGKAIAQKLKLRWIPGTHDVADVQGRRATCNTNFGTDSRGNRQQSFYVREDLFTDYLCRTEQMLIWVSWGERGMAHHLFDYAMQNREKFGEPFKVFHTVQTLRPTRERVKAAGRQGKTKSTRTSRG